MMIRFHFHSEDRLSAGFEAARRRIRRYEARIRVLAAIEETPFMEDEQVAAVHVDDSERPDRCLLTAFDAGGEALGQDVVYTDGPDDQVGVAAEFDHDYTGLDVPEGSDLSEAVASEDGWVVDMDALRDYDADRDRSATRRSVFVATLRDMVVNGEASRPMPRWWENEEPDELSSA